MSSKQTQKTSSNSTATTTPNVPEWIQGPYKDFTGKITDMMGRDPKEFVAGPSALQTQAFETAGGLLDSALWKDILGASGGLALDAAMAGPNLPGASATATMPTLPGVALASGAGASAGSAGGAIASAPVLAPATGYSADKIDPSAITVDPTTVGQMAQAASKGLLDIDLSGYYNPYLSEVVDATKADLQAREAQQLAEMRAEMMGSGAIRGSGRAVREGILAGENARAMAAALGQLRAQGYESAREFATSDLDRAGETSRFNTGETNRGTLTQAELDSARALKQGELSTEGLLANLEAENRAREFTAGAENERSLTQGKLTTDANIASSRNLTDASIATLDAQTRASIATADSATRVALANAQSVNERANLLASLGVDVSKFNATEINDMARFTAGQQDKASERQLSAAGILGDLANSYGANTRGDLELVGDLGAQQREIEQALKGADPAMLSLLGSWLGSIPADTFTGRTVTEQSTGKATTKSSPGLTDLAQLGMSAAYLFSDERTKREVETVGYDAKGRRWVDFAYHWDEPGTKRRGVIAQEVARTDPNAVGVHAPTGLLGVDYSQLR